MYIYEEICNKKLSVIFHEKYTKKHWIFLIDFC